MDVNTQLHAARTSDMDDRFDVALRGLDVDAETRCHHWNSDVDVIAIKFACCETYYPCFECHEAVTDHEAERWPRERFDEPAVLCGVCGTELAIETYLDCEDTCPSCDASFNPGCRTHHHLYFESSEK
jgi:uncharacterized CHY-type Zn-finger protein